MVEECKERDLGSDVTLVIGGGPSGLEWARRNSKYGRKFICVEPEALALADPCFLQTDVFNLGSDIPRGSISTIYADFLLNAVAVWKVGQRGITSEQLLADPRLLLDEGFPLSVRDWFSTHGVVDANKGGWLKINEMMKSHALQQMWIALKVGGGITILDRDYIIDWLLSDPAGILLVNSWELGITRLQIGPEDFERSRSLDKIVHQWGQPISRLGKICLQKIDEFPVLLPPYYARYKDAD